MLGAVGSAVVRSLGAWGCKSCKNSDSALLSKQGSDLVTPLMFGNRNHVALTLLQVMQMVDLVMNWLGACAKPALGMKLLRSEKGQSCWVQQHRPHPAGELGVQGCTRTHLLGPVHGGVAGSRS